MALTKAQWERSQAGLPPADRTPYADYLTYAGVEDTARAIAATPKTTPASPASFTSSVPTMPPSMQPKASTTDSAASRKALTKLQSGLPLTDAEKQILGIGTTSPAATTAQRAANDYLNLGPLGGLGAGVVAGVTGAGATGTTTGTGTGGTGTGGTGTTGTGTGTGTGKTTGTLNTGLTTTQVDSVAAIKALLSSYGIGDLGDAVTNAVIKGYSEDTIDLIMQDPNSTDPLAVAFQKRFPANKARAAAGKSVLSPAAYLGLERQYTEVMRSYGVAGLAKPDTLSSFINNDVSPTEVSDRVGLAVTRIQNADPETKKALATYYPMLNQTDLVASFLDPKEGLPALQRKVTMAEIGGAGLVQGMKVAQTTAGDLADYGITKEEARKGYATIAELTPRADFLSQISQGPDYGQAEAEAEVFKGTASAKRARESLTSIEQARFQGSAGTAKNSLGKSRQGAF